MFWYPKERDYDARDDRGVTLRDFLDSYDPSKYEHPAVTVDNLIFKKEDGALKLLLVRRGRHPYYGMLALPGGFIEMDETLDQAAARELFEETGVAGVKLTQLGAYGDIGRDPRLRIISVAYYAVVPDNVTCKAGDDAAEAAFYSVSAAAHRNNMDAICDIMLQNGDDSAGAQISIIGGIRRIERSTIASDHAIMIMDALERLGSIENK